MERQEFDDRANSHRLLGSVIVAMAQNYCDVSIDAITEERWEDVMGLMRIIDTWADTSGVPKAEVLYELTRFTLFVDDYPSLAPGTLENSARESPLNRTSTIFNLGELATRSVNIEDFINYRTAEAIETAHLFADAASNFVKAQPRFDGKFMKTLEAFGVASSLIDSLVDEAEDLRLGRRELIFNNKARIKIIAHAARYMPRTLAAATQPGTLRQFLIAGIGRVSDRLRSLVHEDAPEYSTLARLRRRVQ